MSSSRSCSHPRWSMRRCALASFCAAGLLSTALVAGVGATPDTSRPRPARKSTNTQSSARKTEAYARPDYVAVLVGRTFLRAVSERDVETAFPLCGPKVQFDGRLADGAAQVRKQLELMISRVPASTRFGRVVGMTWKEATARFGSPPARLSTGDIEGSVVVAGRLAKSNSGLIVFLKKLDGRYRVVGLTD